MNSMRTRISIPDRLFEEMETARKECRVSRNEMITLAIGEYLGRIKSRKLLERLNASFVADNPMEAKVRYMGKKRYARKVLRKCC
jgi:metal-responsive CopG/Arc/MetJ family transcriptional regulator